MSAGALSGAGSGSSITDVAANGFGEMSSDEFIKVLMTELSNQDPFEPQDSGALLEQMSNLRNIESQLSLQDSLETLVMQQQMASAGGMIGNMVQGLDGNNDRIQGLVASVRMQGDDVMLELDTGRTLAMDRVERIWQLAPDSAQ